MKSPWFLLLLCLTGLIVILMAVDPSWAGNENQVAMVVDFGNGQIAARCVSFQEDSITGYEALQRSGLPVETDFQTGGAAICRIDGQGCPLMIAFVRVAAAGNANTGPIGISSMGRGATLSPGRVFTSCRMARLMAGYGAWDLSISQAPARYSIQ